MELRKYLQVVRRHWVVVLVTLVVATGSAVALVFRQAPVYESASTFVVRPRSLDSDIAVRAFDTLIRGVEINATYARIARSELIRDRAEAGLEDEIQRSDFSVGAEVITGTNILEITVAGPSPEAAQELAAAIGDQTLAYVASLNEAYQLEPLDEPDLPSRSVAPNRPLTIAMGIAFGLALGLALALIGEYLRAAPAADARTFDVLDPRSGAYNDRYLRLRLQQELRRAERTGSPFVLATVNLDVRNGERELSLADEDLQLAKALLERSLADEDVLASLGDGTFAALLPERRSLEAEELVAGWVDALKTMGAEDELSRTLNVWTGICEFGPRGFAGDRDAQRVARTLAQATVVRSYEPYLPLARVE